MEAPRHWWRHPRNPFRIALLDVRLRRDCHTPERRTAGLARFGLRRTASAVMHARRGGAATTGCRARRARVGGCHYQRLDGLPLAVELAAARVRALGADGLLASLCERLDGLTAGGRGPPRHPALRAAVEWSLELLARQRLELRALLGVRRRVRPAGRREVLLVEGFDPGEVTDLMVELVDWSMVEPVALGHTRRYRPLETMRHYGVGTARQTRRRHRPAGPRRALRRAGGGAHRARRRPQAGHRPGAVRAGSRQRAGGVQTQPRHTTTTHTARRRVLALAGAACGDDDGRSDDVHEGDGGRLPGRGMPESEHPRRADPRLSTNREVRASSFGTTTRRLDLGQPLGATDGRATPSGCRTSSTRVRETSRRRSVPCSIATADLVRDDVALADQVPGSSITSSCDAATRRW